MKHRPLLRLAETITKLIRAKQTDSIDMVRSRDDRRAAVKALQTKQNQPLLSIKG